MPSCAKEAAKGVSHQVRKTYPHNPSAALIQIGHFISRVPEGKIVKWSTLRVDNLSVGLRTGGSLLSGALLKLGCQGLVGEIDTWLLNEHESKESNKVCAVFG